MSFEHVEVMKDSLRQIARECVAKGPGYAQEGVVLQEARKLLGPRELDDEQMILEAWQGLFVDGEFAWGYDLDNPRAPFFHRVVQQPVIAERVN